MEKTRETCYYGRFPRCPIMNVCEKGCFAWADEEEAKRRGRDIKRYREMKLPDKFRGEDEQ